MDEQSKFSLFPPVETIKLVCKISYFEGNYLPLDPGFCKDHDKGGAYIVKERPVIFFQDYKSKL